MSPRTEVDEGGVVRRLVDAVGCEEHSTRRVHVGGLHELAQKCLLCLRHLPALSTCELARECAEIRAVHKQIIFKTFIKQIQRILPHVRRRVCGAVTRSLKNHLANLLCRVAKVVFWSLIQQNGRLCLLESQECFGPVQDECIRWQKMCCCALIIAQSLPISQRHAALADGGRGGVDGVVVHDSLARCIAVQAAVVLQACVT